MPRTGSRDHGLGTLCAEDRSGVNGREPRATEPRRRRGRLGGMHAHRPSARASRPLAVVLLSAVALAACTGGPTASGSPAPSPSATPGPDTIDHPTGATDVVLRMEEGGGFVAPGFFVTQGPAFTLYGDGTVIWRDPNDQPPADTGRGVAGAPYRIGRLDEAGLQALLHFAVADGALGIAKLHYDPGNIADAGSTTFTLHAGGIEKVVDVVALGMGTYDQSPDRAVIARLAALRDRLSEFSTTVRGDTWKPERYRGILTDTGFAAPTPWPWPELAPADFVPPDPNTYGRWHTLTPDQAAGLGIDGFWGGVRDAALRAADGTVYGFSLRPLWPDETR
jgi:hypothetical protein